MSTPPRLLHPKLVEARGGARRRVRDNPALGGGGLQAHINKRLFKLLLDGECLVFDTDEQKKKTGGARRVVILFDKFRDLIKSLSDAKLLSYYDSADKYSAQSIRKSLIILTDRTSRQQYGTPKCNIHHRTALGIGGSVENIDPIQYENLLEGGHFVAHVALSVALDGALPLVRAVRYMASNMDIGDIDRLLDNSEMLNAAVVAFSIKIGERKELLVHSNRRRFFSEDDDLMKSRATLRLKTSRYKHNTLTFYNNEDQWTGPWSEDELEKAGWEERYGPPPKVSVPFPRKEEEVRHVEYESHLARGRLSCSRCRANSQLPIGEQITGLYSVAELVAACWFQIYGDPPVPRGRLEGYVSILIPEKAAASTKICQRRGALNGKRAKLGLPPITGPYSEKEGKAVNWLATWGPLPVRREGNTITTTQSLADKADLLAKRRLKERRTTFNKTAMKENRLPNIGPFTEQEREAIGWEDNFGKLPQMRFKREKEFIATSGSAMTAGKAMVGTATSTTAAKSSSRPAIDESSSTSTATDATEKLFDGKRFVLTGEFSHIKNSGQAVTDAVGYTAMRKASVDRGKYQLKDWIQRRGGRVTTDISGMTNYLVIGHLPGKIKYDDAVRRRIKIVNYNDLRNAIMGLMTLDNAPDLLAPKKFSKGVVGNDVSWGNDSSQVAAKLQALKRSRPSSMQDSELELEIDAYPGEEPAIALSLTNHTNKFHKTLSATAPTQLVLSPVRPSTSSQAMLSPSPGLYNLGNTCYMNAVLQMLFHSQDYRRYVKSFFQAAKIKDVADTLPLTKSLVDTFNKLQVSMSASNMMPVHPGCIKQAMDVLTDQFQGTLQQDAHEFFMALLGHISGEMAIAAKNAENASLDFPTGPPLSMVMKDDFDLEVEVTLCCMQCRQSRTTPPETYNHLSLEVVNPIENGASCSLDDSLTSFFRKEVCECTCTNTKCSGKQAQKSLRIVKRPKALLLHLKRFVTTVDPTQHTLHDGNCGNSSNDENAHPPNGATSTPPIVNMQKNTDAVTFAEQLSLDQFLSATSTTSTSGKYKLQSIVHHHGSEPSSGHYTVDTIVHLQGWNHIDDTVSSRTTFPSIAQNIDKQKSGYMYLYLLDTRKNASTTLEPKHTSLVGASAPGEPAPENASTTLKLAIVKQHPTLDNVDENNNNSNNKAAPTPNNIMIENHAAPVPPPARKQQLKSHVDNKAGTKAMQDKQVVKGSCMQNKLKQPVLGKQAIKVTRKRKKSEPVLDRPTRKWNCNGTIKKTGDKCDMVSITFIKYKCPKCGSNFHDHGEHVPLEGGDNDTMVVIDPLPVKPVVKGPMTATIYSFFPKQDQINKSAHSLKAASVPVAAESESGPFSRCSNRQKGKADYTSGILDTTDDGCLVDGDEDFGVSLCPTKGHSNKVGVDGDDSMRKEVDEKAQTQASSNDDDSYVVGDEESEEEEEADAESDSEDYLSDDE